MSKKIFVGLLIILVAFATFILWPSNRRSPPKVSISLIAVTNWPDGSIGALCKLENRGDRMVFYSAWGDIPKYSGVAKTPDGETELHGISFTGSHAPLPTKSKVVFHVDFPTNTVSWKITAYCIDSDFGGELGWKIVTSRAARFVPGFLQRAMIRRAWKQESFEVSTSAITNVPAHTAADISPPQLDPSATGR